MRGVTVAGGFLLSFETCQGVSMLAGGLCEEGREDACLKDFAGFKDVRFTGNETILQVDDILAQKAAFVAGDCVRAAGAAANVPGYRQRTGGVIGSPRENSESAGGKLERLACGLWLLANPGGPGYVLDCSQKTAERLFLKDSPLNGPDVGAKTAADYIRDNGVAYFMFVADGTGEGAKGAIAVCGGNELILQYL